MCSNVGMGLITAPPLVGSVLGSVNDSFVIAEWRDPGAPAGPPRWIAPLHRHHNDDEAWYVVAGTLGVKKADDEIEAPAGSAIFVPRGTPHTYWNASPEPLRYLLIMTPKIYALIQAIHVAQDRSPATLKNLFEQYDSELLQ
jgi:mannose-6-phosphate isomerase-like protein (cupin superfamily)